MSNIFDDLVLEEKEDKNHCKGLYFRGIINDYYSNDAFTCKRSIKLLKRKSCKGCPKCGWILDRIKEDIESEVYLELDNIKNGKIYGIKFTYSSYYIDEYDFVLYEVEEED